MSDVSTSVLSKALAEELAGHPDLVWRLQGLGGGATAHVLVRLLSPLRRPVLVIAPTSAQAEELTREMQTVLGEAADELFSVSRVHHFSARETPALELISPAVEAESARTAALYQLLQMPHPLVVTSPEAMAVRTPPPTYLSRNSLYMVTGENVDLDQLDGRLEALGYRKTGLVEEAGEYAVRGGIADVWPPGYAYPCRLELFGDTIESLRCFDPADQRSIATLEELIVLPNLVFAPGKLTDTSIRGAVGRRCEELGLPTSERRELDDILVAGFRFPGIELFLPYASEQVAWLGDYLPERILKVVVDPSAVEETIEGEPGRLALAEQTARQAGTFFPDPASLFVDARDLRTLTNERPLLEVDYAETLESSGEAGNRRWRIEARANARLRAVRVQTKIGKAAQGFAPLAAELTALRTPGRKVIVTASDPAQLQRLEHLLSISRIDSVERAASFAEALIAEPDKLWLVEGHLHDGFTLAADGLTVVTDEEIFGEKRRIRTRRRISRARALTILGNLEVGDHMVHVDHGIGCYRGLKHLRAGGTEGDFIHLEYAGGDRYYLPVDRINLVEKYIGGGAALPRLDKLGGTVWTRTKKRVKESILEMAQELLELEAFRAIHTRSPFAAPGADYEEFEARFPFEETEGQQGAIRDVVADMMSSTPMDRLVCGDVGYGKTEVAMRAAYLACMGGRQVAVLVPTTVLASQHMDTLGQRFDGYPIRVAMMSRFQDRAENLEVAEGLQKGTVDIVVGTHRLLQKDIRFARLGLLVVDEEHRFGVAAKERIKSLKREVDVLTLTATPIPRTLQLALGGVRDLSLIETPPVDRLAIRTYVARFDEGLIKQAILRELGRGGQVFVVHNRVASIGSLTERIRELVPSARIAIGHGQMRETELEKVMLDFLHHRSDVLVSTSIIESGLDIPNANTIIISRADSFGLAQLYQIRGRVGRSFRRAYAYMLVPAQRMITRTARRRLAVLQELDDLGSGFRLAAHDLEIRGAGNLLGKQQSGQVSAIGFDLFMRMLEEATQQVRGLAVGPRVEPEIDLGAQAYIPDDYIDDVGERLLMYKRIANVERPADIDSIAEELADRFGPMPPPAQDFLRVMALRPALKTLAVEQLKAGEGAVSMKFHEDSPVVVDRLVALAESDPMRYRLRPDRSFTVRHESESWDAMVDDIQTVLQELGDAGGLNGLIDMEGGRAANPHRS